MNSVCFQGKPFSITVIQVYAPTSNAEETEVEWFYEDLQDPLELTPKKDVKFGKLSSGHRTGKGQFSFQSQTKAMPKNAQTTTQLHSSHTLVK